MATPKFTPDQICIADAVSISSSTIEELRDEIQEWYDNLPEQFQNGDKGEEIQTAIDALQEAFDKLEEFEGYDLPEVVSNHRFSYQKPQFTKSTYMSRQRRLEIGTAALRYVPSEPDEIWGPNFDDDEIQAALDLVHEACDALDSVSFPSR